MSQSTLSTEEFPDRIDDASVDLSSGTKSDDPILDEAAAPPPPRGPGLGERITSRLSLLIGAALVVIAAILAIGYFQSAQEPVKGRTKKKSSSPIDWLLSFGGAKKGQTFEKFIKDSTIKSEREWDAKFRDSPASRLGSGGVDWSRAQIKLEPSPGIPKPTRRSP